MIGGTRKGCLILLKELQIFLQVIGINPASIVWISISIDWKSISINWNSILLITMAFYWLKWLSIDWDSTRSNNFILLFYYFDVIYEVSLARRWTGKFRVSLIFFENQDNFRSFFAWICLVSVKKIMIHKLIYLARVNPINFFIGFFPQQSLWFFFWNVF